MKETNKIELHGDISIPFLKKSRFTGSFKGMRYVLIKHDNELEPATEETPAKTETVIRAIIWPEPFNFEVTPDEKKTSQGFSVHHRWNLGGSGLAERRARSRALLTGRHL